MKEPWTHEELKALRNLTDEQVKEVEAESLHARGLPPMAEDECLATIFGLLDKIQRERAQSGDDFFLLGQLIVQLRMAVEARMLGAPPGRYYVLNEEGLLRRIRS